jgi:hypothetical protein
MICPQLAKLVRTTLEWPGKVVAENRPVAVMMKKNRSVPKLFLPWNPPRQDEEQAFSRVIHTMKKKIY